MAARNGGVVPRASDPEPYLKSKVQVGPVDSGAPQRDCVVLVVRDDS